MPYNNHLVNSTQYFTGCQSNSIYFQHNTYNPYGIWIAHLLLDTRKNIRVLKKYLFGTFKIFYFYLIYHQSQTPRKRNDRGGGIYIVKNLI